MTNVKDKMTSKTTKTVLFASLIATLLLPFSGMMNVDAVSDTEDTKTKQYVKNQIKELQETKVKTDKIKSDLSKLKLVDQWFEAKDTNNTKKMRDIMDKITADFPEKYTPAIPESEFSALTGGVTAGGNPFIPYTGSTEKHWDCRDDSDLLGYVSGTMTGYTSALYIVSEMHYPYEITDGPAGINCTTPDWDNSKGKYTEVLSPGDNCLIDTYSSSTDTEGLYCTELSAGSLVHVEGQSWYDGNIIFSPWASETIKYIG